MEYHFGRFGSAALAMSPPKILPTLSLLVRGECWRDSFYAVQALLSSNQNTGVINIFLAANTKHSTMRAAVGKINSI